jgi:hypothetical protein
VITEEDRDGGSDKNGGITGIQSPDLSPILIRQSASGIEFSLVRPRLVDIVVRSRATDLVTSK